MRLLPCIPIDIDIDASGRLKHASIRLVEPLYTCQTAVGVCHPLIHQAPKRYPCTCDFLGVILSPTCVFLRDFTVRVHLRCPLQPLLPNDRNLYAAQVSEESSGEPLCDLYIPDNVDGILRHSSTLLWIDPFSTQWFRSGSLVLPDGLFTPLMKEAFLSEQTYEKLCRHSTMRRASDYLEEFCPDGASLSPDEGEIVLVNRLQSPEFSHGLLSVYSHVSLKASRQCDCTFDQIRDVLGTIVAHWKSIVEVVLQEKDGDGRRLLGAASPRLVTGRVRDFALILTLKTGQLETNEDLFLQEFAEQLNLLLPRCSLPYTASIYIF